MASDESLLRHRVAWPPGSTPSPAVESELTAVAPLPSNPACKYSFPLDPFQRSAIACVECGQSMLVAAHTSAGKTLAAEYAIAAALRDGQRAVYASPIKALSNQKYRDFKERFGDVGLITGDVTISEDASCLVLTTEVLRVMLHRSSAAMREVKWVVFDELHLLGSRERGWVLEESIILLPPSVRVVMLSATVPNAFEIAEWVASVHGEPTHVIETTRRPTPLRHYVCPLGGRGLHCVQDEDGVFDEAQWHSAVSGLPEPRRQEADGVLEREPERENPDTSKALKRAAEVARVIDRLAPLDMLPVIVFCFSRCALALALSRYGGQRLAQVSACHAQLPPFHLSHPRPDSSASSSQ